jgi:hypothetical protein
MMPSPSAPCLIELGNVIDIYSIKPVFSRISFSLDPEKNKDLRMSMIGVDTENNISQLCKGEV